MSVSVDQVVSEFIARVDGYERDVNRAAAAVDVHTAAVERNNRAESKAETDTSATRKRRTSAEAQAAREQIAIQKQAAKEIAEAEKAASKASADAVKASAREQAAAVKSAEREKQAAIRETERVAKQAAASVGRDGIPVGPGVRPIKITEPPTPRITQAEYEAAEERRLAAVAAIGPSKSAGAVRRDPFSDDTKAQASAEREINHAIADRAALQAGLVASTREETILIRDQLTQLNLVAQYKRAGLSESEAAIRAEEVLSALEGRRIRQAEELAAVQAAAAVKQQAAIEKQLTKQSAQVAGKVSLFIPALVGGVGAHELSEINDEYIRFSNSLKVAGVSALAFSDVQDNLLRTSTRTGAEIGSLADTYRSIALASHDLDASQGDILKVTDAVANSLRITGASGGAARAAILQLGHAFETGKVTAREFNGLALNAYPILQAAAGSDKYGGSVAKLRAALIAGDLSSKEFFDAILKGSDTLESRANKAALTTAQGFTALRNALVVYVGSADQANGVSAALGAGLQKIAENLDVVIPAIAAIGTALTVGYISRAIAATAATEGLGAALLGAFGGPIGLAITALTLTIGGFFTEVARHDAVIAQVNASFDEMRQRLRDAGDSAGLAASQTAGVGTAAQSAVPGVENLTGKVRSLANELFRQADAAKKARIETAAKAVADADRQERAAMQELPSARDSSDGVRPGGLFNFRNYGRFYRSAVGNLNNLFNDGAPDREAKQAYARAVAVSQQARRDLAAAYQSANGGAADVPTDPKTVRALAGLKTKLDGLESLAGGATGKRLDHIKSQIEKTRQQIADIEAGASPAAARAAESGGTGRGRRGPSAETLARRAEAARQKGVRDDRQFDSALREAQAGELAAQADITNDAAARAQIARERVLFQRDQLAKEIASKGPSGTKEFSAAEVAQLQGINARTADIKVAGIDLGERRRNADDIRSLDRAELEARRDALQSRGEEAKTLAERQRVAQQILDIEYEIKAADLRAIIADPTRPDAERVIAGDKLRVLSDQKSADQRSSSAQYEGPLAKLRRRYDDPATQVEQAVADKLQAVDDAITDAAAKTLGVKDPFLRSLLQIFLEQNVLRPLYDTLQNAQGEGGSGGFFKAIGTAVTSIFGHRATGGPVVPGAQYLVGERGPEVVQFAGPAQVYPNGRLPNVQGGGGNVVLHQTINVDGSGVNPQGFAEAIIGRVRSETAVAIRQSGRQIIEGEPSRLQRRQTLGN